MTVNQWNLQAPVSVSHSPTSYQGGNFHLKVGGAAHLTYTEGSGIGLNGPRNSGTVPDFRIMVPGP